MSETPETTTGDATPETSVPAYSMHAPTYEVNGPLVTMTIHGHLVGDECMGEDSGPVATLTFPSLGLAMLIGDLLDEISNLDPFSRMLAMSMLKDIVSEKIGDKGETDSDESGESPGFAGGMILPASSLGDLLGALGISVPDASESGETDSTPSGVNEASGNTGMYM